MSGGLSGVNGDNDSGKESTENYREWDLILEELKSLRAEELSKMDKQYQIIGFGISAIAALLALAIQYKVYSLFFVLPIVIISVMCLYHYERSLISNIGAYIKNLEDMYIKTKVEPDKNILGWERWLTKNQERRRIYASTELALSLFMLIMYLLCVSSIIMSPLSSERFEFINSSLFRYTIAFLYILLGFLVYYKCNFNNFKECLCCNSNS
ncbi:MAG: hypothetical protein PHH67_02830 [Methanosarcina sp.]|nr:hypothetical protein [Methanosarcina sp.]MDD4305441.1 hypothetical protein [Methanosarcina sp.]